jgi:hypothetical protein
MLLAVLADNPGLDAARLSQAAGFHGFEKTTRFLKQLQRDGLISKTPVADTPGAPHSCSLTIRGHNALRLESHHKLILDRFLELANIETIAAEHDLPVSTIRNILKAQLAPDEYLAINRKKTPRKYATEEMLQFVQEASAAGTGPLTRPFFDHYAQARLRPNGTRWPKSQTYVLRFGSWADALKAAGVQANPTPPWGGKRIDREECVAAVCSVMHDLGRIPTRGDYLIYAQQHSDRSMPSLATIKKRSGTWPATLLAARASPWA